MIFIERNIMIAGQITPETVGSLSSEGIRVIVNNRPDGEMPGQPSSAAIEAAACAAGIDYQYIPIGGGIDVGAIDAARAALAGGLMTLMFCKSGMRSALLWAAVRSGEGRTPDELISVARAAGVEIGGFRPMLVAAGEPAR